MIVVFDASMLVYLFDENARAPIDPATGQPTDRCKDRIEYLVATLQREKAKIIVPTPALGEVLVKAGAAAPDWLRILNNSRYFRIAPFDERAAVEFAATQAARLMAGTKPPGSHRQKAKFDDQIVAIAAVEGADVIFSDDGDIRELAGSRLGVKGIADLPLPPEDAQMRLELDNDSEPEPPVDDDEVSASEAE